MTTFLRLYIDACVFAFGAVVGSFLNVCIHRMPRGESLVQPPSHCPHCQQPIRWFDNIPLVSYLILRGRCRHCRKRISPRYVLVELLTAVLFLGIWLKFEYQWIAPIYWLLVAGLIAATFIDFEHFIIPNEITLGGIIAGFALSVIHPPLMDAPSIWVAAGRSALGIVTGGGLLWLVVEGGKLLFGRRRVSLPAGTVVRISDRQLCAGEETVPWEEIFYRASDRIRFRAATLKFADRQFSDATVSVSETTLVVNGTEYPLNETGLVEATTDELIIPREAMGFGDVKLMAAIGAFLGWQATVFTLVVSSLVGGLVGLILIALGLQQWKGRIPYGPYLALGAVVWLFAGNDLVNWYLSLVLIRME